MRNNIVDYTSIVSVGPWFLSAGEISGLVRTDVFLAVLDACYSRQGGGQYVSLAQ